jgi:Tail fiber protein gp32
VATLTVANIAISLSVPSVFVAPVPIQGFAPDSVVEWPDVKPVEVLIGVDRRKSSGYVAHLIPFRFTLQADSPSLLFMETWWQNLDQISDDLPGNMSIISPGLGKAWSASNGSLTSFPPGPKMQKLAQPQTFEVMFESITVVGV